MVIIQTMNAKVLIIVALSLISGQRKKEYTPIIVIEKEVES